VALMTGSPTPEKSLAARRHVEASLEKDDNSAESWGLLANLLISDYLNAWNQTGLPEVDRAEKAYKRALSIDPSVPVAHYAAGFVRRVRGDHQGALDEFDETIKLNPNFARAYAQKANELTFLGRAKDAVSAGKKAVSLSPRDPSIGVFYWVVGRAYFVGADYKDAAVWLRKSVDERPNLWFNRAWLVSALGLSGQDKQARAALAEFKKTFATYTLSRITEIYTTEDQYKNDAIRATTPHLFEGLRKAGL